MNNLTIHIYTFGYHRSGIPADTSGNGGGFVFDCRCIENPGMLPGNMMRTGLDPDIIRLLDGMADAQEFFALAIATIEMAVERYALRGYESLMIAFGCTGGQHRSVYMAERTAEYLRKRGYRVEITHTEKHLWP